MPSPARKRLSLFGELLSLAFSRGSEAWKEQSQPIFRFWAEADWWDFPFLSLSASRYFGEKQTLCLY